MAALGAVVFGLRYADRLLFGSHGSTRLGPRVTVHIPSGASTDEIGQILSQAHVIDSATEFSLLAFGTTLQAGTYSIHQHDSASDVIAILRAGPPAAQLLRLVIPEGFAIRDIARIVPRAGVSADAYNAAVRRTPPPSGFLKAREHAPIIEGFLFPATYEVAQPGDAAALVAQQQTAFTSAFSHLSMAYATKLHLTRYDVLKIASLVEREAAYPGDRAKIARVIYNRLHQRMALGIDATIQYAVGSWRSLTASDLLINSPYNTRIHVGLPPTPICNPGLASMKAAAAPLAGPWLYYVAIPNDPQRRTFFTASYAEFLRFLANHHL